MATDFTATITAYFEAITYVAPSTAEVDTWNGLLNGGATITQLQTAIINGPLAQDVVDPVIRLYQAALDRVPDEAGASFWVNQVNANPAALNTLAVDFANSPGFMTLFNADAATPANTALVNGLYLNILGRVGDPAGVAFWASSGLNAAQLLQAFANAPAFISHSQPFIDAFQTEISTPTPASPPPPASPVFEPYPTGTLFSVPTPGVSTFTLTVGIDNDTTSVNNAVFTAPIGINPLTLAPANTLNTGDILTDTGVNGTLNATVVGGGQPGTTINGIANANFTELDGGAYSLTASLITGLTSLNSVNSTPGGSVTLGGTPGTGLGTALTSASLTGTPGHVALTAQFAAAALASNPAISVTISDAGAPGVGSVASTAAELHLNAATAAATYGTYNILVGENTPTVGTTPGNNWLEIGNGVAGAATKTINIANLAGDTGSLVLTADTLADFTNVTKINADQTTGAFAGDLVISGAAANQVGGYAVGGAFGLIGAGSALTSFTGGSGSNFIDLSALLSVSAVTTLDDSASTATDNTVVLNDAVLTSGAAIGSTWLNVQVIGDSDPGAAGVPIVWSNLPSTATTLTEFGVFTGAVTVTAAPATFTLNVDGNDQTAAAISVTGPTAGTQLNLTLGDANYVNAGFVNQYDVVGTLTTAGYPVVAIASDGNAETFNPALAIFGQGNIIGQSAVLSDLTAPTGSPISLDISGPANFISGTDLTLTGNGSTIDDTGTGSLVLLDQTGSGASTNATTISAASTAGLLMQAGDSVHVTGGVQITGSAAGGNFIMGSIGNDTLQGGTAHNTFVTQGGSDTITLGSTHGATVIDLFSAGTQAIANLVPGNDAVATAASITSAADLAQPGYWSLAPGAAPASPFAILAAFTGTSVDQSVVSNFLSSDSVSFSVGAWGSAAPILGLTSGDLTTPVPVSSPISPPVLQSVANGGNVGHATDLIVIPDSPTSVFANASALVTALDGGGGGVPSYLLNFAGSTAGNTSHILIAYDDSGHSTHIADVDIQQSGTTLSNSQTNIVASDMVKLTGVADSALTASNIHFLA
jgi:uncharacterized protein DUF4214